MSVEDTCGRRHEGIHLVVGADGKSSPLKKLIVPQASSLAFRGYKVYRGHSPLQLVAGSFQTWGVGARFACVPTPRGTAWFAAVTDSGAQSK